MTWDYFSLVFYGFEPFVIFMLLGSSFIASFITVAFGIGGGVLLLAAMASLMPGTALIPVHGVIQVGSNLFRVALLNAHVHWPPVARFAVGTAIGVGLAGGVAINLPSHFIQIGVGGFVIWSVLTRPPKWLSGKPLLTGGISSFLTMFFGATGVFVANFTKSLALSRQSHVATHATLMLLQHLMKILVFGLLGFAYGPWVVFIIAMIGSGFLGTLLGKMILEQMTDHRFHQALNVILILISVRLIWSGVHQWFWVVSK